MKINLNLKDKISGIAQAFKKKSEDTTASKPVVDSVESTYGSNQVFRSPFFDEERQRALELQSKLLKKYSGVHLDDYFKGRVIKSEYGSSYCIEDEFKCKIKRNDIEKVKNCILSDLQLIRGIGEKTELSLKNSGYNTICDLTKHNRYGSCAKEILTSLENNGVSGLLDSIPNNYPKSHPTIMEASKMHKLEDFVFYDIETMGLFGSPIILFGMSFVADNKINTKQFLLRNINEEPSSLYHTISELKTRKALVTFNGKSFDMPFTQDRLGYYRMNNSGIPQIHYDLLHFSRRAWGNNLENCKLQTIEKELLGESRKDDVPSSMVPEFYRNYLRSGNIGPLVPIVEHNKIDVVTSAKILNLLWEEW
ncbi:ribonuclease H-like domain-containing protein [Methanococcus maripaludis]|uniref:YprB ribonuclease H-like domain-containing protein n=1 Tax=Methanococcus maripaludis (strain DSM 14266 / JCM 13030 / NBRC 101832 / S2 / LL) TaxID=267377 RepID=Q6LZX8_METMP|nr:ribonuclease H-like domain-containing protein [Methanococcus maripaludis]CAF30051.1 conserved hypothetical protein [Methanococcus maripaludis S2]